MSHSLSDPNNHAPAVTPDDGWDDGDFDFEIPPASALLPARRQTVLPAANTVGEEKQSLRISVDPQRVKPDDSEAAPQRLQVQEISGQVVKLGNQIATPRTPRQIIFQERVARPRVDQSEQDGDVDWGSGRIHSKRWLVWMSVGVLASVLLALCLLPLINSMNDAPRKSDVFTAVNEVVIEDMDAINAMVEREPDALRMFRQYAGASHPNDFLPFTRDGEKLRDTISSTWRPLAVSKNWIFNANTNWSVERLSGHSCGILSDFLPDHTPFQAFFIHDGKRLVVDWKATAAYGSAAFSQLENGQGDSSEIRGIISAADTYSDVLPETEFQSCRFKSPDGGISLWCYARRSEAAGAAISPLIQPGEITGKDAPTQRITLKLARPPDGARPNQWLITEMLHIDWLAP